MARYHWNGLNPIDIDTVIDYFQGLPIEELYQETIL
jgi:hypothetical protein